MNKYPSIYSSGKLIRADQFLCEILCQNRAKYLGVDLPANFWSIPEWAAYYKSQLKKCNSLLEIYSEEVIIKVLKKKNIWSLLAKWVEEEINKEQKIYNSRPPTQQAEQILIKNSLGKQTKSKNLDYLDN